jgi:aminoglycoside phosphotransferase (APT) family kinase protein
MATEVPAAHGLSTPPDWSLARVPGLESGQRPLRIERLSGGTVNEVFRVDSAEGAFVLRLDGPAYRRPGVDRARELILHRAAAAGGVAPAIVVACPQLQGLLITQFQPGCTWTAADYADSRALHRLGERLFALHHLPCVTLAPFDPLQVALSYLQVLSPQQRARTQRPMQRFRVLCQRLAHTPSAPCVIHGDLWEGNLLQGDGQLWLLDWEYAQCSDPLMDVACVLAYYPGARPHGAELLAAAGLDANTPDDMLTERVDIYRTLNWLWYLARGEAADLPADCT